MPQLDVTTYPSQILWLIVTFIVTVYLAKKLVVPNLSKTCQARDELFYNNKSKLEKILSQISKKQLEGEKILQEAKDEAKRISESVEIKIKKDYEKQLDSVNKAIDKQYKDFQKKIENQKSAAIDHVLDSVSFDMLEKLAQDIVRAKKLN